MKDVFRLTEDWGDVKPQGELVLYGMGRIGRRVFPTLSKDFRISVVIDKDTKEKYIENIKILQLPDAMKALQGKNVKIVVTTVLAAYKEIAKELKSNGLQEYKDFCHFERFAGEWNLRWQNRCVLSKIDTVITGAL